MSKRVIVGMSGGVDSAVAALLLKEAGYEVIGVTLRTWESGEDGEKSRCCEIDDARDTARQLGIAYHVFNCLSDFRRHVVSPFVDAYIHGLTPNPCVNCNRFVKWERMIYYANILGADSIATGHYASVVRLGNGRYTLQKADYAQKDQTYMLWRLTQEQLSRTLMPLGRLTKQEVRSIAEQAGLPVADKPDSQEICFVPDGSYADFIAAHAEHYKPDEGNFVDEQGRFLGRHKGVIHYTVGQRKGLGIALGEPVYVSEIRADSNEVVLGKAECLLKGEIFCRKLNFMRIADLPLGKSIRANIKIRYHDGGCNGTITRTGVDTVCISFDGKVRAPAPGQSAVFYDASGCILGGGEIF